MQSNAVECSRVKGYDVVVKFGKTMNTLIAEATVHAVVFAL